ncbi:MAG: sulfotransferase [Candidatus Aminicenantes bacterium]|nr:sulfotransferase [Candidatus Aminicenantes bacterium]
MRVFVMTMPNFLLIGAAKCGTTSCYHYLEQHPQVYLSPVKEPMFFVLQGRQDTLAPRISRRNRGNVCYDRTSYVKLFEGVRGESAVGEASVQYFHSSRAPDSIKKAIPNVKLIAILRDPSERAWSSYLMSLRNGTEYIRDFWGAVQAELGQEGSKLAWWQKRNNIGIGFYFKHLRRYYDRFQKEQIKVYLLDDLKNNPKGFMTDIFHFLGVDMSFEPDLSKKYQVEKLPGGLFGRWMFSLYSSPLKNFAGSCLPAKFRDGFRLKMEQKFFKRAPALDPGVRRRLVSIFRDDIEKLEKLLNRDLSHWLAGTDKRGKNRP